MQNNEKNKISISVRNLVEFILRSGSIESGGFSSNTMADGARIHRKIQKAQGEKYTAEVSLKYLIEKENYILTVEGRADGIIDLGNNKCCLEEIKTVSIPLELIDDNFSSLHWAQAKVYAFIYTSKNNLEEIEIRLTYCHHETEQIINFQKQYTFSELSLFFENLISRFHMWAEFSAQWYIKRDRSLCQLKFPFPAYRKGQRELAIQVYKVIKDKLNLFAKAPTGIGKTISTVFPALKALGEGHMSKIFYLTAKTITRQVVQDALEKMRNDSGLILKSTTLTAKEKICLNDKVSCSPDKCLFASGHYDRINDALWDLLNNYDAFTKNIIEQVAEKHKVCPFELSLDSTLWSDAIICDYNYVFDPSVYLKRFFSDGGGDFTFLIDEAHNLVDRSREMFSAKLSRLQILEIKKIIKISNLAVVKKLNSCNTILLKYKKQCNLEKRTIILNGLLKDLINRLNEFAEMCKELLAKNSLLAANEQVVNFYFDVVSFIKISELFDEHYVTYIENAGTDTFVKMFCVDPSHLLKESLKRCSSAVFFSATLLPIEYYKEILGGKQGDKLLVLDSSFDPNNRCLVITNNISVRYVNRDSTRDLVVKCIESVVNCMKGNYLVFSPSYSYMQQVYDSFISNNSAVTTYLQSNSMSEDEREQFLSNFQPGALNTTVGFCVLGGMFSEGIDLKDDRLIGAVIIGVGLPQLCVERDIIRDYFDARCNSGFEYAYLYPGMNKVLQAAGRVIRSESDRGIIVLIDERFSKQQYKKIFPKDWFPCNIITSESVADRISKFWDNKKNNGSS